MLINKNTKIIGHKVILIPYLKDHVPKYHEWMKSPELQELTASEPLTLEQEYEMQKSWMMDNNKCTFIILNKEKYEATNNELDAMIGDTNLFFINFSEDEPSALVAEAEIMIAEKWARGLHCGWEAMLMMLLYGIRVLNVQQYMVKVSNDNMVSINMFEKMGFIRTGFSQVFNEVTMEKLVDEEFKMYASKNVGFEVINYL